MVQPAVTPSSSQHDPNVVLRVDGITKRFDKTTAVNGLTFDVRKGEVLGFLGPNGAGKSTTVGMVLGLIRPTAGKVEILGRDVANNQDVVSKHVGAIIENPAFYPYLSGRRNLKAHALAIGGVPDSRIDQLLELVNLHERKHDAFKKYSLGMKQRLGIASTLLSSPDLVILDEPTNGLDPAGQREIREIIPRLAREGHSVLLASHMLHEVEQVSDRVIIVRRGELVTQGAVGDLLNRDSSVNIDVPSDQLETARGILSRVDGVDRVEIDGSSLKVYGPAELGREYNYALGSNGIYASAIVPRKHSLEDIFLDLTENSTV